MEAPPLETIGLVLPQYHNNSLHQRSARVVTAAAVWVRVDHRDQRVALVRQARPPAPTATTPLSSGINEKR